MNWTKYIAPALVAVVFAGAGYATTTPYISNKIVAQIAAAPLPVQAFTNVRANDDDRDLILYAKLCHNHVTCDREGRVDQAIEAAGQNTNYVASLPMRRQNNRGRSRYRSGLRTKIPIESQASAVWRAFYDHGCQGAFLDCEEKVAVATVPVLAQPDQR